MKTKYGLQKVKRPSKNKRIRRGILHVRVDGRGRMVATRYGSVLGKMI